MLLVSDNEVVCFQYVQLATSDVTTGETDWQK